MRQLYQLLSSVTKFYKLFKVGNAEQFLFFNKRCRKTWWKNDSPHKKNNNFHWRCTVEILLQFLLHIFSKLILCGVEMFIVLDARLLQKKSIVGVDNEQ